MKSLISSTWLFFRRIYITIMLGVIGRALQAISQTDSLIKKELAQLPEGFSFEMKVLPNGPGMALKKNNKGEFIYLGSKTSEKLDLSIGIKHMAHAFLLFSFQEGTARSFANDRIIVDGEISCGMIIIRSLNHMESIILPKFIAKKAVKRYPHIGIIEKVTAALKVYLKLTFNLFVPGKLS